VTMMFRPDSHLLEVSDALVDPRVGIIANVTDVPRHPGGPDFFTFHAQACNTAAFVGSRNFGSTAGSSLRRERAIAKALGEAIERYCSAIYDPRDFLLHTHRKAPKGAIDPELFALYSNEQYLTAAFPYRPFTRDSPVRWTTAIDLTSQQLAYVPAAMVYVPYYFSEDETPFIQPMSTGLACHTTYERAVISGICEVIERDSFSLAWLQGFSPPRINLHTLSDECRAIIQTFERTGRNVVLLNITRDTHIPTILAVQNSDHFEIRWR